MSDEPCKMCGGSGEITVAFDHADPGQAGCPSCLERESEDRMLKLLNMMAYSKDCACGVKVWFVGTKKGKRMPVTAAGVSHFADCPLAKDFRRSRS